MDNRFKLFPVIRHKGKSIWNKMLDPKREFKETETVFYFEEAGSIPEEYLERLIKRGKNETI